MVPNGWSQETLEDLSIVERGKFSARPRNDPRYFGGEMPFVQTGDVTGSKTYLNSFTQTLNQDGIGVSKVFPKGTILITIAANIGDTAITSFDVACPDSVVAIQPYSTKADTYWLKNVLDTKKEDLDSQSTQNAQKNINLQVLKPLVILTPPLSEQKKIAKILSTWDKAISTAEQLLANSQQQKKALMQQLLTGKKRLLDIKTGVIFERDFKTLSLRDVCSMQAGKFINASDILNGHQDGTYPCFGGNGLRGYTKTFTHDGEFSLIGRQGALCGNITFATGCFHATEHAVVVTPRSNINTKWLYYALVDLNLNQYATGVAQPGLSVKNIEQVSIKVPESINEQQKIAAVLSAADQEITTLKQKLDALKQEKKALMQQLLTGKRRVQQLKDVES
ncbi:UNVERIFIED_CONTAM: restriction endonuclease subunit S [Aeromonas salmonicida]